MHRISERVRKRKPMYRDVVAVGLVLVVASVFMGCTFDTSGIALDDGIQPHEVQAILESAPLTEATEGDRWLADSSSEYMAYHGYSCAQAAQGATKNFIGLRVEDHIALPKGVVDTATVFMNGWEAQYLGDSDHEVLGLGGAVFNISRTQDALHWEAGGILSDKNGDDAFRWCYRYTVVMWAYQPNELEAIPLHRDFGGDLTFVDTRYASPPPLRELPGVIRDPLSAPRAVLPRGFGLMYDDHDDHHVLQLAFDFGATTTFFDTKDQEEKGDGPGMISWVSQMILKDNSTDQSFTGAEMVSALSGRSVNVIQPDYAIRPRVPTTCPNFAEPALRQDQVSVEVPFDYAVPMLTGWNIGDVCTDHHIKRVGAWIEDFSYEKDPEAPTGILTYTIVSVFRDDGGWFGSMGSKPPTYKVSILGLNNLNRP